MPHETATAPFEPGDDDFGDFILDIWLPFARDDCNWVDNRAPAVGTRPDIECWTHRGTVGSPESPFIFLRTLASHLMLFTGIGVDTGEEVYDQPGNPCNGPQNSGMTSISFGVNQNSPVVNSAVGPYEAYWLFSDTAGEYIYCVLKVSAREYRHFCVGKLKQIDGGDDLDSESFWVGGHGWGGLDPDSFHWDNSTTANQEHAPYFASHRILARTNAGSSTNGAFARAKPNSVPCANYYMPGLQPISVTGAAVNNGGSGHAVDDIITVELGDGIGTAATLRVTSVNAGVIDGISVETAGDYTNRTLPSTGVAQASTTGSGIDATFDLTFEGHAWYIASDGDGLEVPGAPLSKAHGGVNASGFPMGNAKTTFYDAGLGSILFTMARGFSANANSLVPIYVSTARDFQADIRQGVVAQIPDMFRVNMRDYSPEQVITIGGEDYIVFPTMNKDSVNVQLGEGYSGWEGIAYRRETGAVV